MGKTSCILFGLSLGWCLVVSVLLGIMHSGSFWSYNQSLMVLTVPVTGLFSTIGLLCGIVGSFMREIDKTSSYIGIGVNSVVLLTDILLAL